MKCCLSAIFNLKMTKDWFLGADRDYDIRVKAVEFSLSSFNSFNHVELVFSPGNLARSIPITVSRAQNHLNVNKCIPLFKH